MNRIWIGLLIIVSGLIMVACQSNENDIYTEPHPEIDQEAMMLFNQIPLEFDSTIYLPGASSSLFRLRYVANGEEVSDFVLEYDPSRDENEIDLEIYITYESITKRYSASLIQVNDGGSDGSSAIFFEEMYRRFMLEIPMVLTSNTTLPTVSIDDADVSYEVSCSEIERGRIVYTFPTNDLPCDITMMVEFHEEEKTYSREVTMSSFATLPQIPRVYIDTSNQDINSKDSYVSGTVTLEMDGYSPYETFEAESMLIKLRGNSTLFMPKRSYKIKFDRKIGFLQEYEEYDWVLLANFSDHTLVRNYVAYQMAAHFDMDVYPSYRFVDVYVNGEYQGNYLLTDQVEATNDRVDIEENSSSVDTGYLIEYDLGLYREGLEASGENYFLLDGIPFVIHTPGADEQTYSNAQKTFIQDYIEDLYQTLQAKQDYSDLIDEESFVDWFIISEVFKNVDAGYSSVYMYKDAGGLLHMGPVWDFDLSTGNPGHLNERGPEGWYTSLSYKNVFYYHLMQYPEFQDALKRRWNQMYDSAIITLPDEVLEAADSITHSRYRNFETWDIIGKNSDWYTAPEIYDLKTYDEQVWFLYDYLMTRIAWLDEEINKF